MAFAVAKITSEKSPLHRFEKPNARCFAEIFQREAGNEMINVAPLPASLCASIRP